jgi:transcriptional regulator with XRE-family HTH domain
MENRAVTEPEELNADRFVVAYLRRRTNMTQTEFEEASGVNQSDISKYERGEAPIPEANLRRLAEGARLEWNLVVHLRRFFAGLLAVEARGGTVEGAEPPDLAVLRPALLAAASYLLEAQAAERRQRSEEERREAEEIWTNLQRHPVTLRRELLGWTRHASRSCALMARICEASAQAADRDAKEARELADLALFIAGRVPEELRSRAEGYCWAHLANARRAGGDFDGAEEAFALAWKLWQAGAHSELLPERRLLDLEASLRRGGRRGTPT